MVRSDVKENIHKHVTVEEVELKTNSYGDRIPVPNGKCLADEPLYGPGKPADVVQVKIKAKRESVLCYGVHRSEKDKTLEQMTDKSDLYDRCKECPYFVTNNPTYRTIQMLIKK